MCDLLCEKALHDTIETSWQAVAVVVAVAVAVVVTEMFLGRGKV